MKSWSIQIILSLLLALNVSCRQNRSVHVDTTGMATIELSGVKDIDYPSLIDTMALIPLETTDDALIGDVDYLFMVDDKIVVADILKSQSVFIFDRRGKFIKRINGLGRSPNEYIAISHVALTHDKKQIAVYDDKDAKVLFYDLEGRFVSSQKVGFDMLRMEYVDQDRIATTTYGSEKRRLGLEESDCLIYFTNEEYSIESGIFENRFDRDRFSMPSTLKKFNDTVYLNPALSDTIYTVGKNGARARYRLDMSSINGFSNPKPDMDNSALGEILARQPIFGGQFVDGDRYLFFYISNPPEGRAENYVYDKITGETAHFEPNWEGDNHLFYSNMSSSIWASGNRYLTAVPAFAVVMVVPEETRKKNELLKNLSEDDNPVLVLYTLKNETQQ